MASIWKRTGSKYWVACFTDANGRQLKRSTKTTDRRLAQSLADDFEKACRTRRTILQAQRVLSDIRRGIAGEGLPTATVREFATQWLERKKPEVGDATYRHYVSQIKRLLQWLADRADGDLGDISRADLTAYRNDLSAKLAGKSVNHALQAARSLFKDARRDGLIADDPSEFVDAVREGKTTVRRTFGEAEIRSLLSLADVEWRSLILFGLYTGQRLGDIALFTWRNIDLEAGEIRFTARKTDRPTIIPLADPLRRHIAAMTAGGPGDYLHPESAGHIERTGRVARLSQQFATLLAQAGFRPPVIRPPKKRKAAAGAEVAPDADGRHAKRQQHELTFHCLRHTATSIMKAAGIPASVVQDFIGHSDAAMSRIYTHTGTEALKKAANALPDLEI